MFCSILENPELFLWKDFNFGLIKDLNQNVDGGLHLLLVPLDHQNRLRPIDHVGWFRLFNAVKTVMLGIDGILGHAYGSQSEYKLEINSGEKTNQTLFHTHVHLFIYKL